MLSLYQNSPSDEDPQAEKLHIQDGLMKHIKNHTLMTTPVMQIREGGECEREREREERERQRLLYMSGSISAPLPLGQDGDSGMLFLVFSGHTEFS